MEPDDLITDVERVQRMAAQLAIPFVDLSRLKGTDGFALFALPAEIAAQFRAVPIRKEGNHLWIAVEDLEPMRLEELSKSLGLKLHPCLAMPKDIDEALADGSWWRGVTTFDKIEG